MNIQDEINAITHYASLYATAKVHETALEDARALVKDDAIGRIMVRENIAITRAEKVVERDEQYMKHRQLQHDATKATIMARARYESAKLNAQLAVDNALPTFDKTHDGTNADFSLHR